MKTFKQILIIQLSLFVFLFSSCSKEKTFRKKIEKTETERVEIVKTLTLEEKSIVRKLELSSTLDAYEKTSIAPSIPGRIDQILVDVGHRVNKGQMLVKMDQANYIQAKLALENLRVNFERVAALDSSNNISKQTYDQTKSQYEIQKENLEYLSTNTFLKAPFSGIIANKNYENGEQYGGIPILNLIQINKLKSIINIPEAYYPQIKEGMQVKLYVETYPNKTFTGKIETVYPTIDPASHSFQVKIVINNQSETLRPGMFCRVNLDLENVQAIVVPSQAVLKTQGSNERYIYINDKGIAKRIVVKLGDRYDDQVEISSTELKLKDEVVIAGQGRIRTGDKLKIVK